VIGNGVAEAIRATLHYRRMRKQEERRKSEEEGMHGTVEGRKYNTGKNKTGERDARARGGD